MSKAKRQPCTLSWLVKGIWGWMQSILGVNTVSQRARQQRMAVCLQCKQAENYSVRRQKQTRCRICGCVVWHKAHVASENCPEGKWMDINL